MTPEEKKDAKNKYAREHYRKNREKILAKHKKYNKENYHVVKARYAITKDRRAQVSRKCKLKRRYNMTLEDYDNMVAAQQGKCAICLTHHERLGKPLYIDHCHTSGKVRGLLCLNCNSLLGLSNDQISILEASIKYLSR